MAHAISVLSSHILFSQFRGPFAFNMAGDPPADPPSDPPADPPKDPPSDPPKVPKDETEGRITQLANDNKELKKQLKEFQDAKKTEEDDKAKKKGDYEKLLSERDTSLASEKKRADDLDAKVKAYEEYAQAEIKKGLDGIKDADKKKSAEAMLEGLTTEEQLKRLPNILTLVGSQASGFGQATPPTEVKSAGLDQKKTRFEELMAKEKKEALSPKERSEKHVLMTELGKIWEEEQAKAKAS